MHLLTARSPDAADAAPGATVSAGHDPALRLADARISTGVRLHYAEQGDDSGPAVVLLHGYSDSWFSFRRVLPLLPERYHVFALSLRGHGDSDRPAGGYSMPELAADVIAFLDARGIERATILGHSMGSFVAQQVALAAPQRVEGLVLVGSATELRKFAGMDELAAAVRELEDPVSAEFVREFQYSTVHQPVPEEFMQRVMAESGKLPARVWRALMDGILAAPRADGLRATAPRTLILRGELDSFCTAAEQEALRALIPGAVLRTYAEVAHTPHWEQPARFARDLTAFLDEGRTG